MRGEAKPTDGLFLHRVVKERRFLCTGSLFLLVLYCCCRCFCCCCNAVLWVYSPVCFKSARITSGIECAFWASLEFSGESSLAAGFPFESRSMFCFQLQTIGGHGFLVLSGHNHWGRGHGFQYPSANAKENAEIPTAVLLARRWSCRSDRSSERSGTRGWKTASVGNRDGV